MAIEIFEIRITAEPIEVPAPAFCSEAGAIVDFLGVVRGTEAGRPIAGITYEAHAEMARYQLGRIARAARERFDFARLILHHRIGFVPAAQPSLFLRVSAERRKAAFDASRWVIEELKKRVPIWKHPAAEQTGVRTIPHADS